MEQPKAVLKRAPTSVGLPPMEQISEEAKRRDRARKRAEEKKNKEEYAKIRKRQEEIDKKRAKKEVDPMAGKKTVTREQVMAYMCGLVAMYGQNPTQAQARSYSQSNHKLIFPKNVISALGASSWEEVVAIYKAYALTDKRNWRQAKTSNSKPVEQKLEQAKQESDSQKSQDEPALNSRKGKRYTKEELLGILRELWEEMDGKVTQSKLFRRSKEKPTPSWQTLISKLGPSSTWREQLFGSEPEVVTPEIVAPEPEVVEPEVVEPEVEILEPEDPEPNQFSMELKITVPGMPAPVVMEFTVK